jgi:hypothetical protein
MIVMPQAFDLIVGISALTFGTAGLAFELYRRLRGAVPMWKTTVNALWAFACIAVGLFFILDSNFFMAAFVLLASAGAAHQMRMQREMRRQGLDT